MHLEPSIALYEKSIGVLFFTILTHLCVNFGVRRDGQFQFTKCAHQKCCVQFLGLS